MSEDIRTTSARWLFNHDLHFKTIPPMQTFDAYAKAVMCCANGDGKLSPAERDWVLGYFAGLGAPEPFIEMLRNYAATDDVAQLVEKAPEVNHNRRSVVFDAIRAASADGEFHPGERAAVEKLAIKLGLTKQDVSAIEAAYNEEVRATEKRLKTVFPAGIPF
jgi:tellurite resistance protein